MNTKLKSSLESFFGLLALGCVIALIGLGANIEFDTTPFQDYGIAIIIVFVLLIVSVVVLSKLEDDRTDYDKL